MAHRLFVAYSDVLKFFKFRSEFTTSNQSTTKLRRTVSWTTPPFWGWLEPPLWLALLISLYRLSAVRGLMRVRVIVEVKPSDQDAKARFLSPSPANTGIDTSENTRDVRLSRYPSIRGDARLEFGGELPSRCGHKKPPLASYVHHRS